MTELFAALRPHQRKALLPYPYAVVPGCWTPEFEQSLKEIEPESFNTRRNDGRPQFVVRSWSGHQSIYVKDGGLAFQLMAMAPGDGAIWVRNPNLVESRQP